MTRQFTSIQNARIIKLWLSNHKYSGKSKNKRCSFIGNTLFFDNYPVAVKVLTDDIEENNHPNKDGNFSRDIFPDNIGEVHAHIVISLVPFMFDKYPNSDSLIDMVLKKTRNNFISSVKFLNDVLLAVFDQNAPEIIIEGSRLLAIKYRYSIPDVSVQWSGKWLKIFKYDPNYDPEMYMTGASDPDESGCNLSWNDLRAIIDNMDPSDRARNVVVHVNNGLNETLDVLTFSFYPHGHFSDIHPSACLECVYDE
jgi:hypothetical protein